MPDDPAGKARDVALLNVQLAQLIADVKASGKCAFKDGVDPSIVFGVNNYYDVLSTFQLDSEDMEPFLHMDKFLMHADMSYSRHHVDQQPIASSCQPLVVQLRNTRSLTELQQRKRQYNQSVWQPEQNACQRIHQAQQQRTITLRVKNLFTCFPDRWFDSVVIDAYLKCLKAAYKDRAFLYLNSAQKDLDLRELAQTPPCYRKGMSALYRDNHWTFVWFDHDTKEIWHFNSDVVDLSVPQEQTQEFHELFPGYTLHIIPCIKQCDNSSCGAYVCFWAYCFLYRRSALMQITCPDIVRFRTVILNQLLFTYLVRPLLLVC